MRRKYIILAFCILIFLAWFFFGTWPMRYGRYQLGVAPRGGIVVLDTATSDLWLRTGAGSIYLGTNNDEVQQAKSEPSKEKDFVTDSQKKTLDERIDERLNLLKDPNELPVKDKDLSGFLKWREENRRRLTPN